MNPKERLIVALDVDTEKKAIELVEKLKNDVRFFKVGFELFSSCGPSIITRIKETDSDIFLDLKFHDIPNTVAKAAASITKLGAYMFNVHALGGYDMMKETLDTVEEEAGRLKIERPKVIAVTVLTSMDEGALKKVGVGGAVKDEVLRLAALAKEAGLDGVVASAMEAKMIRKELGDEFLIVTPGVRPAGTATHDQKRVATPGSAINDGASFIVVGRPITEAINPVEAAQEIIKEIEETYDAR
jgi:orotidine-5'-phosphate decarboxylase